jgi:hypothetical protein
LDRLLAVDPSLNVVRALARPELDHPEAASSTGFI